MARWVVCFGGCVMAESAKLVRSARSASGPSCPRQGDPQMLPADQWPHVLANVRGVIVHGTERVSSNRLMNLLSVENDPTCRREVGKRTEIVYPPVRAGPLPSSRKRRRATDRRTRRMCDILSEIASVRVAGGQSFRQPVLMSQEKSGQRQPYPQIDPRNHARLRSMAARP